LTSRSPTCTSTSSAPSARPARQFYLYTHPYAVDPDASAPSNIEEAKAAPEAEIGALLNWKQTDGCW